MKWLVKFSDGEVLLNGSPKSYSDINNFGYKEIEESGKSLTVEPEQVLQDLIERRKRKDGVNKELEAGEYRTILVTKNTPTVIREWFEENSGCPVKVVSPLEYQKEADFFSSFEAHAENFVEKEEEDSTAALSEDNTASLSPFERAKKRFNIKHSASTEMFDEFSDFTEFEKKYLADLYEEKASRPELSSALNNLVKVFTSAGFAVALTQYNIRYAIAFAVMSLVLLPLGLIAIYRSRTELSREEWPDLYDALESVVESNDAVSDPQSVPIYLIDSFSIESPFTIPYTKPSVYVPKSAFEDITLEEYKVVFEHEIGHYSTAIFSMMTVVSSAVSSLVLAPLLVTTTSLQPGVTLFGILLVIALVSQTAPKIYNRWGEKNADSYVTDKQSFVHMMLRLHPERFFHVDTKLQSIAHRLIDEHPPMNRRIEQVYDNEHSLNYSLDRGYSIGDVISSALVVIGSILTGVGLLTLTTPSIPIELLAGGVLVLFVGKVFEGFRFTKAQIVKKGGLFVIAVGIIMLMGTQLGADTIAERIGYGYFGGIFSLMLVGLIVLILSISYLATNSSQIELGDDTKIYTDWKDKFIEESKD